MDGPTGAPEWVAPEPRQLPDLRGRLVDYLRGPAMHASLVLALRAGHGAISPRTGDLDRDARILIDEELERLDAAELFYVDRDMTRLAVAATETLPVHGLHPHDVPAPAGFCVFAEPIEVYHPEDGPGDAVPTPIVAASWGGSRFMGASRDTGLWMTIWTPQDREFLAQRAHQLDGVPLARARAQALTAVGPLAWDNEVTIRYGGTGTLSTLSTGTTAQATQELDEGARGADIVGGTMHTAMIVRSAWLLMTQPGITDVTGVELGRAEQRRARREGREPPAVRVVRIRRPEDQPTATREGGRTFSRRWTVRGHWRRQWYPSRGDHRPVWINPHVKGPEGAPLGHQDTVHLLDGGALPAPSADIRQGDLD